MNQEIIRLIESKGYRVIEEIGKGGFATCYTVHSNKYNQVFVCKVIDANSVEPEKWGSLKQSYITEINILSVLTHPNIIALYDHFQSDNYLCMVLGYCPNGSLTDIIRKNDELDEKVMMNYIKEIARAIDFTHKHSIAHHDIKPSNILIDRYGRAKLADFGLSKKYETPFSDHFKGTIAFMPPEVLKKETFDPYKADVWAFGVTIFSLYKGELPFQGATMKDLKENICTGQIPRLFNAPRIIRDLIQHTIVFKPEDRFSMGMIINLIESNERSVRPPPIPAKRTKSIKPKCMSPMAHAALRTFIRAPLYSLP